MSKSQKLFSFYRPHDRARYQFKNELVNLATGEVTYPPSRTKQSFADECDINNILKQYKKTGMIAHVSARAAQGMYTDLPSEVDFQESLNAVIRAEDAFASLPSKLRTRFGNDPSEFLAFVQDPRNTDELVELGLAIRPPKLPAAPSPAPGNPPAPLEQAKS